MMETRCFQPSVSCFQLTFFTDGDLVSTLQFYLMEQDVFNQVYHVSSWHSLWMGIWSPPSNYPWWRQDVFNQVYLVSSGHFLRMGIWSPPSNYPWWRQDVFNQVYLVSSWHFLRMGIWSPPSNYPWWRQDVFNQVYLVSRLYLFMSGLYPSIFHDVDKMQITCSVWLVGIQSLKSIGTRNYNNLVPHPHPK